MQRPQATALPLVYAYAFDLYCDAAHIFGTDFVEVTVFEGTFIVMDSEKDACGIPIKLPLSTRVMDADQSTT